jgi:hypothetical protein
VNDPFARLALDAWGNWCQAEQDHIVFHTAAAAHAALLVTGDARIGIEYRPEPIAASSQWIVHGPNVFEQHFAGLDHGQIDILFRRSPVQHPDRYWCQSHKCY